MNVEYRMSQDAELRIDASTDGRKLTWYPAVFDSLSEDLGGFRERIGRRAFTKTLAEQDIPALFNHNPDNLLGRTSNGTLSLSVDLRGLKATVTLPDTQLASDIQAWVDRGDLTGGSFAFRAVREQWGTLEDGTPVRTIAEARLYDVAPVVSPAYPETAKGGMSLRSISAMVDTDLERIALALIRRKAGLPPTDEEMAQVRALSAAFITDDEPVIDHSIAAAARGRHLQLLALRRN